MLSARLGSSPRSDVLLLPHADMPTDSPHSLGAASSRSLRASGGEDAVIMGASTDESDNVALMEDVPKNKQVGVTFDDCGGTPASPLSIAARS